MVIFNLIDAQVQIYHIFKNKEFEVKKRIAWADQFWQDIKEMGGAISRVEGECEVENSSNINLDYFMKIEK